MCSRYERVRAQVGVWIFTSVECVPYYGLPGTRSFIGNQLYLGHRAWWTLDLDLQGPPMLCGALPLCEPVPCVQPSASALLLSFHAWRA